MEKEEASGSPFTNSFPENSIITVPSWQGDIKNRVFLANTCHWLKPMCKMSCTFYLKPNLFIAFANNILQYVGLKSVPSFMVFLMIYKHLFGKRSFITVSPNTILPKYSGTLFFFHSYDLPPIR